MRKIFEQFFTEQLAGKTSSGPKRRRCGVCEVCQLPDCGNCKQCKDMVKFGGNRRSKQCCIHRRCPNMAVKAAEDDDSAEEVEPKVRPKKHVKREKKTPCDVKWVGEPTKQGKKLLYSTACVNGMKV